MTARRMVGKLIVAGLVMGPMAASAQQPAPPLTVAPLKPVQAAKARHESFEDLDDSFEALLKEAKRAAPDAVAVQRHANRIDAFAKDSVNWFPPGSGPGNGFKTKALP